MKLQALIEQLRDPQEPMTGLDLSPLSNLTREQATAVGEIWHSIALDKRQRLLATLGEMAEEDVRLDFSALFRHALEDSDATVRRLAIVGLWEDESLTLIRPLLSLLLHDPSDEVRASAAAALGRFLDLAEMDFIPPDRASEIVEALISQITEGQHPPEVRRRALEAVAASDDARVATLIARAYEEADELMRASALFAMGRSGDEAWSGTVRAELRNPDPRLRFEAVRAAGELGDRQAAPLLIALAQEPDVAIREAAIGALGQVGGSLAKKALRQWAAEGPSKAIRRQAREALAELALLDDESSELMLPGWAEVEEEEASLGALGLLNEEDAFSSGLYDTESDFDALDDDDVMGLDAFDDDDDVLGLDEDEDGLELDDFDDDALDLDDFAAGLLDEEEDEL